MQERDLAGVIDLAIKKEEEAYDFYMDLCDLVENDDTKSTLGWVAAEEQKHKEFLLRYRAGEFGPETLRLSTVTDYRIADHLGRPDPAHDLESKEVYLIAAHRELNAYNFYKALADIHREGRARDLILKIANEELKHKEKMEYLYANAAFPQTAGG